MQRLLPLLSLLFCITLLHGQKTAPDFVALQDKINNYLSRQDRPSLSIDVAVTRDGEIIYQRTFNGEPGQRYPLASVTKPITATAILQLAAAGRIDLDTPAKGYLSDTITFPDPGWEQVTVRHLLNHTAGLGMYYRVLYRDEPNEVPSVATLIERHGFLFSAPGQRFEYANLGYAVLGEIVERISGVPYGRYVRERIFASLGGKATGLFDPSISEDNYAPLFGISNDALPYVFTDTPGAGDLYGTAADLALFGAAHLGHASLETGRSVVVCAAGDDRNIEMANPCQPYQFGWFYQRDTTGTVKLLWHDGGLDGAHSTLRLFPADDLVIAVTTNTTFTVGAADSVAAILQTALTEVPPAPNWPVTEGMPFAVDSSWHGKWTGNILTATDSFPFQLDFREDGTLVAAFLAPQSGMIFTGNQSIPLRMIVDHTSGTQQHFYAWLPLGIIADPAVKDDFHIVQLDLRRAG
ncbi:MAG: serine hydrolase domain-containing protein, partial [Bacteroidota bacterium]